MTTMRETPGSAYIHFPFCVRKCLYCDFVSQAGKEEAIPAYIESVRAEIRHTADVLSGQSVLKPLDTVYLGGGTPTLATSGQLAAILQALRDSFGLTDQAEISLEANPGTMSMDECAAIRQAGFNRISIGLQAVQPHLLRTLGRIHLFEDYLDAVRFARQAGFDNIGADIMFGLPGQTLSDVRETLRCVLDSDLEHISYYSLQVEPGTPFHDAYSRGALLLPDPEIERDMYHTIRDTLSASGRAPYEISSSARPGYACRHHLVYWAGREYYGFGCAAHGYVGGMRRQNEPDLDAYMNKVEERSASNAFPAAEELERIDREEERKEVMMLGFRLEAGVDSDAFLLRFGVRMEACFGDELRELNQKGLIETRGRRVRLTPSGRDVANQVFMAFV